MAILGLLNTESFANERMINMRRKVFYDYPNGAAPLTGILSMLDGEETNDPKFTWWEKRFKDFVTTTASQGSSKGPIQNSAGADPGDPVTWTADTEYFLCVASNEKFRVGHVIKAAITVGGVVTDIKGIVTSIATSGKLKVRAINTVASIDNGTTNENVGKEVMAIGSAFSEGSLQTSTQVWELPLELYNYTQIFRTPFSFTGTALKTSAKFDSEGPYKDKAKDASLDHMIGIERALLFGARSTYTDPTTGLPTRTFGGILWHLQQWEAGTTYGVTASTVDTDDNKRIITNSSGSMTLKTYNGYLERLFRKTNNRANEKLCLCGSGFLNTMNAMYKGDSVLNSNLPMTDTYGLDVIRHRTPFGLVYYKTHPLFNENSTMRYNGLFLDVQNMRWRKFPGRDTDILKNRQPNDADYRLDEWFTEGGFELQFPESNMYLQNVQDYTP